MKKAAVLFPGIGYHTDKPLLYYSKKIAAELGYEIIEVPYGKFPRQGQRVLPTVLHRRIRIIRVHIRHAHPANLDSSSILRLKALGRVKIKARIQLPEVLSYHRLPEIAVQKRRDALVSSSRTSAGLAALLLRAGHMVVPVVER